jgi:hypothetical protein
MDKDRDVRMSLVDACLVRMSEILPDPIVLTTDPDFRIYRRHRPTSRSVRYACLRADRHRLLDHERCGEKKKPGRLFNRTEQISSLHDFEKNQWPVPFWKSS